MSHICDVIESKNTMTSKSYDKPGCNIEEVMDVVHGIARREMALTSLSLQQRFFLRYHVEKCL